MLAQGLVQFVGHGGQVADGAVLFGLPGPAHPGDHRVLTAGCASANLNAACGKV